MWYHTVLVTLQLAFFLSSVLEAWPCCYMQVLLVPFMCYLVFHSTHTLVYLAIPLLIGI